MKGHYRFSLIAKITLGTLIVSAVTYGTSAFFLFVLNQFFTQYITQSLYIVIVFVLGVLWSGLLGFISARFLVKNLKKIERSAHEASQGKLNISIDIPKSNDEMRTLAESFQKMIDNLRTIVINTQQFTHETTERIHQLSSISGEAKIQAVQIREAIDMIIEGAEHQTGNAQETQNTIKTALDRVEVIQEHVNSSKKLSEEMEMTLRESEDAVSTLIAGLYNITQSNHDSLNKIKLLEQNAKEIDQISNVVGNFATQTHLLSLNAAIESARAGEHGKGFAVVATEIQKLANESQQAVKKINELVTTTQSMIVDVAEHIESQVTLADEESLKGKSTNKVLSEMRETINQVVSAINDIFNKAEEQKDQMQITMSQAENVTAIAEETTASAQQVGASIQQQAASLEGLADFSEDLTNKMELLQRHIDQLDV